MTDSTRRFQVTRLRLGDFRSIKSCDVPLGDLAVLVGPNGAGKSNFLDALQLVADALKNNLMDALSQRLGGSSVVRNGAPTFSIDIEFRVGEHTGRYAFDVTVTEDPYIQVNNESLTFADDGGSRGFLSTGGTVSELGHDGRALKDWPDIDLFLRLSNLLDGGLVDVVTGFAGFQVLNPVPARFIRPEQRDLRDHLDNDAANLASIWEKLTKQFPDRAERVLDYVRVIIPGVENVITVAGPGERYVGLQFEVRDDGGPPVKYDAASMSYGTLRAFAVLVGIFGPYGDLAPPIAIEEPESGLHPIAAAALLDALHDGAERRQVLVSTHSAELLDVPRLDPDRLIVVRKVGSVSSLGPMDSGARAVVRDGSFSAGDLLRDDQAWPEGYLDDLRDGS